MTGQVKMAVRVYERYSMFGGNRASLIITALGKQDKLFVTTITSGKQAGGKFRFGAWHQNETENAPMTVML